MVLRHFMPIPHSVEDQLLERVDEFCRAYEINAITPAEYEDYGPIVLFRSSFEKDWKSALGEVAKRRTELKL